MSNTICHTPNRLIKLTCTYLINKIPTSYETVVQQSLPDLRLTWCQLSVSRQITSLQQKQTEILQREHLNRLRLFVSALYHWIASLLAGRLALNTDFLTNHLQLSKMTDCYQLSWWFYKAPIGKSKHDTCCLCIILWLITALYSWM